MSVEIRKTGINYDKVDWLPQEIMESGTLSKDIHRIAAREKGLPLAMYLENVKSEKMGTPSPYYGLDPIDMHKKRWEYKAKNEAPPLRAFEEICKAAGLKAWSAGSDTVEKWLSYSDTAILFAEVISDRVFASLIKNSVQQNYIAVNTQITGNEYSKIMLDDVEADRQLAEVAKGQELPIKLIKIGKHKVNLKKFGLDIRCAYEDVKWQRVNVLGVVYDRIGLQMAVDGMDDLVYTAINGDGNSNTPGTTITPATANSIEMADCIEWWTAMPNPYSMNRHLSRKAIRIKYATALADLKIGLTQFESNIGINIPLYDEWDTSTVTTGYFIGFDTRYAMEYVTNGEALTETDKIIQRQIQDVTFSIWEGHSVIDNQAIALWNTTSSG